MEMPEVHKVEIEGAEILTIKGEKGDTPTDEHLVELITPLIPEPVVGPRGERGEKGDSIVGPTGATGLDGRDGESIVGPAGKDGSSDTPEQVKEKLLEAELTIEDVKDLRKELDDLKKKWTSRPMFGGRGFSKMAMDSHFIENEIVAGSGTTFTLSHIPSPVSSLKLYGRGQRLRPTTDFTISLGTISTIDTWSSGDLIADFLT
jgi:hypothetical protein